VREEDLGQHRDHARRQPALRLQQLLVAVAPTPERMGVVARRGEEGVRLQQRGAQIVAHGPQPRAARRGLELCARHPAIALALGQLHGREQVEQRGRDRDRQAGALAQLADLPRLVEGGHEAGLDGGGQGCELPHRSRE
jgi:hypothetical protein